MISGFLIFVHILICIALVLVVLLQSSKVGGLAGAFGGGAMGAMFGSRGAATFLSKVTTGLAIAFMLSCLAQSAFSPKTSAEVRSAIQAERERKARETSPASALPFAPPAEEETPSESEATEE